MLQELRVENLALIDSLQLDFSGRDKGLVIFTGETGAGKSIILQALYLLAGGKGSAEWIRADRDQAVIEAFFDFDENHSEIKQLLEEYGLESDSGCIIRRLISPKGRNRVYINDRLMTARCAGDLAENLVSIASQHDHQQLLSSRRHLDILDTFGELWDLRGEYSRLYTQWAAQQKKLGELRAQEKDKEQRRDFLLYQLKEIEDAHIVSGEDEELIRNRDKLRSSEMLMDFAGKAYTMVSTTITERLAEVKKNLDQVAGLDPDAAPLAERVTSLTFEVEDIEGELRRYMDSVPADQSSLEEMNARIALLKQLQRKYGATLEEVIEHGRRAKTELDSLESVEQEIVLLEKKIEKVAGQLTAKAAELSAARRQAGSIMERAMQQELASLSFAQAVFRVGFNSGKREEGADSLAATGAEDVEFLFSANPGEPVKPLAKIASGGELSRLMLSLKCLLARRDKVDTVIFDEIDSGIGGKAAEAVGAKIRELAAHHQVFCITHLPQIAAHADTHYQVSKRVDGGRTHTEIKQLTSEERIMELAGMLGGNAMTEETVAFARDLITRSRSMKNDA